MPVPEERLHNSARLHRWFAVSSVLMTGSILWMIEVDYDRPWREIQDHYYTSKAALAHLEYLEADTEERRQEMEEASRRLADAREYVKSTRGTERDQLQSDLVDADLAFRRSDGHWSRKSQVLDVTRDTYEKVLGQFGEGHPETKKAHQAVAEQEEVVEKFRKEKEKWEDKKKQLERQLKQINDPVRLAAKRVDDLVSARKAAEDKDKQYRGVLQDTGLIAGLPIVKWIINFPLMDFTAPKNTPARQQVNQFVLPDVRQRLNYLESYTTDRCTTCHVAIDDPDFSQNRLARKLERALPAVSEAMQRAGLGPIELPDPPTPPDMSTPLPVGRVTDHWDDLDREQQNAYFDTLLALYNRYLRATGRKGIKLGQPLLAHPNLDLFVNVDSAHPAAKMGCTVCHEGNPQETDFVQAAHSPPTKEIMERWEEEYYITLLGVPNVTFETIEHYWDRPMRLPRYSEAGCAKCHREISDIARFEGKRVGSRINLGRHLFTNVGCINCHDVNALPDEPKVGPDLTYIGSKLKPEFVEQWVYAPIEFRPSTRMPHFFQQENNREESANAFDPDPVLRTETEVAAISRYLFAVSRPWEPIEKPAEVRGDADRGRELFKVAGCLGCHANFAEYGETWITKDTAHRQGVDEETARHRTLGMTYEERVRYAMEYFVTERDTYLEPERARFDPNEAYHLPVFTRFGPELSGVGSKVTFEWLYSWVLEPIHYAPDTRMPSLRLTPAEAADIAAYLMTLTYDRFRQERFALNRERLAMADDLVFLLLSAQRSERHSRAIMSDSGGELNDMLISLLTPSLGKQVAYDLIRPMSIEDKKLMYLGNKMISHYGCYACHKIPGFETATPPGTDLSVWAEKPVSQLDFAFFDDAFHDMRAKKDDIFGYVYPQDDALLNYRSPIPDRRREQITHTPAAFAEHKMLNPRIWDREKIKRPYDKLKMPNFYFTVREAEALTTYLLSRVPPRVHADLKVDYDQGALGPIARGRNLTRQLNCIACHQVEDNAPTIQQYFRREIDGQLAFDSTNAPPLLWGEGAKVQHNWLHKFFLQVEPLRPWLQVRMPSFTLTGEKATTLVRYFASLSQNDSQKLAKARTPIAEYIAKAKGTAAVEDRSKKVEGGTEAAPGSDWYEQPPLQRPAEFLSEWAIERKLMREGDLDSLKLSDERLRDAHAELLKRINFIKDLYDVEYPFVEPPAPLSSPERFELGQRFFNDMGCLKCHVLGDMLPGPPATTDDFVQMYRLDGVRGEGQAAAAILNGRPYPVGSTIDGKFTLVGAENVYYPSGDVETKAYVEGPGASGETERILLQAPSAPNLSLTYQRLRRAWVFDWMLEPQLIQPGTKMPQNFPDGQSPFAGMEEYPGTGIDHINLLVDYLYHAGAVSARAPLQKITVSTEQEEFNEDAGSDEFSDE